MDKKLDQIKDYQKWLSNKNGGDVKKEARRKIDGAKGWIANAVRKSPEIRHEIKGFAG